VSYSKAHVRDPRSSLARGGADLGLARDRLVRRSSTHVRVLSPWFDGTRVVEVRA
jgi:hypothetical protein